MSTPQSSIIIPVYNNWNFTRKCLKSLAANTDREKLEVIVVDNASTDATEKGCPFLGQQLFGERFTYLRNQENRNFSGACNQGAELAKGEYLIFLNNDTEVQKGWLEPLIEDFSQYPDIGATGPLLLYPDETPLGKTVQHLGIFITPFMKLGHLYGHIPARSSLVRKRRFFQAITGACLTIPRDLFFSVGKFDEEYVNGFEDVDLCARLTALGLRMTVNPDSVVVHYEGKTEGRHASDDRNYKILERKNLHNLKPDWHIFLAEDGNRLKLSQWLTVSAALSDDTSKKLHSQLNIFNEQELKEAITEMPYWEEGWNEYLRRALDAQIDQCLIQMYSCFFPWPENLLMLAHLPQISANQSVREEIINRLKNYPLPANYIVTARQGLEQAEKYGIGSIALQCREVIENYQHFITEVVPDIQRRVKELV